MNIKKIMILGTICAILSVTIFLGCFGCSNSKNLATGKINFNKADIGVIETSTFNNTSYLKLYNFDGKKVMENSINCADINSGFLLPVTYNNKVYTNSGQSKIIYN
jgi:hypothetical protein